MSISERSVYAVTALFNTPDEIMHAAKKTAEAGYQKYDVHTPYPLHGMDSAMKLKPSRIGIWTLLFGLMGAGGIMAFISWVTLIDFPLVIGGKPFWAWPAFVPVAFEATVLLAVLLTVATLIVVYFKFPNNAHPLHDTPYMKAVSRDKFGIAITAADPKFSEQEIRGFLASLGGHSIETVTLDPVEMDHGQKIFDPKFLGVLAGAAILSAGGIYFVFNILFFLPPYDWMMVQNKLVPQKPTELFADGIGMRPPVVGTVARGFMPYSLASVTAEEAGRVLVNPLLFTEATVGRGKERYLIFCSPCHGNFGDGDSRLRGQFPNPPSLHTDKARDWKDGSYYHVITKGQNIMPGYESQISREDRWAIVHYIRVLQRAKNAKESDLK